MNAAIIVDSSLELSLAYQPVLDIRGKQPFVCAYESLTRAYCNGESYPIGSLIRKAEAAGTMPHLDRQVAIKVCQTLLAKPEMKVWFNLSQQTLESEKHANEITEIIHTSAVADRIKVEVTETHPGSIQQIAKNLKLFRDNSISVVIDDIEDEHAIVSLLGTDLVTGCKFSRATTEAISHDESRMAMSSKLVSTCKALGKTTVLEGIENPYQLEIAQELGVDYVQGWLFWPAMPLSSVPILGTQVAVLPAYSMGNHD